MSPALERLERRIEALERKVSALENPPLVYVLLRRALAVLGLAIAYWKAREG